MSKKKQKKVEIRNKKQMENSVDRKQKAFDEREYFSVTERRILKQFILEQGKKYKDCICIDNYANTLQETFNKKSAKDFLSLPSYRRKEKVASMFPEIMKLDKGKPVCVPFARSEQDIKRRKIGAYSKRKKRKLTLEDIRDENLSLISGNVKSFLRFQILGDKSKRQNKKPCVEENVYYMQVK